MKTLIPLITRELATGRSVGLATVILSKGSAPRGAGACMLLKQNGDVAGTVGGGVLEHRALLELRALLDASYNRDLTITASLSSEEAVDIQPGLSPSAFHEYHLTQDDVQNLGMVCGGNVSLLYQLITPPLLPFFQALERKLDANRSLWLMRTIKDGSVIRMAAADEQTCPPSEEDTRSSCGRKAVWQAGNDATHTGVFVEPVLFVSHTYIFGGGHVAQRVAPLLAQLDFAPVVYDDREEFASPALFPTVSDVICATFAQIDSRVHVAPDDEIVIMTRGHANDLDILAHALRTPAYYIGLIGSKSKIAHTKAVLLEQGFTEADFSRVHTPIGLPIDAETPMEIAVSVAAEMIACRAKRARENA